MKKSWWPWWVPYPSAWCGATMLVVVTTAVGYFVTRFGDVGLKIAQSVENPGPLFLLVFIGLMLPFVLVAYGHQILFRPKTINEWPTYLPSPQSMWLGFYSFNVYCLSSVLIVVVFFSTYDFEKLAQLFSYGYDEITVNQEIERAGSIYGTIWYIAVAYLYQLERLLHPNPQKIIPPQAESKSVPIDPIETELNKIRGESGLTQVRKPIKKKV